MPHVYGIEHILYVLFFALLITATLIISKKYLKTEKQKTLLVKGLGACLLLTIIWNRIAISYYDNNYLKLLPDSFCGTSSMALALAILLGRKNNNALHCLVYVGFIGGLITVIYPDFIGQRDSIFFSKTISGLLHHTFMVYAIIVMVQTKYFVPTIKKWRCAIFGAGLYIIYGLFLIDVLGFSTAMEIEEPLLDGTKLYWYTIGAIFVAVYFTGMTIFELIKNKQIKKETLDTNENIKPQ